MKLNLRTLCLLALFCALCALGAQVHIYSSVALDALPAFLAAFLLGGVPGAIVGVLGHLLTALVSGFPMTVPLHLVVAVEMAAICYVAGQLARKRSWWLAAGVAFVLNALVSPLVLLVWPGMGMAVFLVLLPSLALGSAINAFGAAGIGVLLKKHVPNLARWHA